MRWHICFDGPFAACSNGSNWTKWLLFTNLLKLRVLAQRFLFCFGIFFTIINLLYHLYILCLLFCRFKYWFIKCTSKSKDLNSYFVGWFVCFYFTCKKQQLSARLGGGNRLDVLSFVAIVTHLGIITRVTQSTCNSRSCVQLIAARFYPSPSATPF
jgi:hypothetical protein